MLGVRPEFNPGPCPGPAFMEVRQLEGHLHVPRRAHALTVFARDPATRPLRKLERGLLHALRAEGFATCQVDLLESSERFEPEKADNIELLADRLNAVLMYLALQPAMAQLPISLIGYESSAAAALTLAARRPQTVRAAIAISGRLERIVDGLEGVQAPTLLVVPGNDRLLFDVHQQAFWSLRATSQLAVVRGAGRRFTEAGTALACQRLVTAWCVRHLPSASPRPAATFAHRIGSPGRN